MALHPDETLADWNSIRRQVEESPHWYRDLVEHSPNLLCVHNLEGRLLSVNALAAQALGYSVEEILRRPLQDLVSPRYSVQFDTYLEEITQKGERHGLLAVLTRSGEERFWEYHNTLISQGLSMPVVRGIAHDVTDRVRAEKALRSTNEKLLRIALEQEESLQRLTLFRTLLDQSNESILVVDPDTLRLLDVNEKASVTLGYSRDELLSMSIFDIDPDADENSRQRVLLQLQQQAGAILERRHKRKDGSIFPVEVNIRLVQLERQYYVAVSRDVTERKRSEERLREFERVVESLEEMITVVDKEHRYVLANRAFLNYRGLTSEQVVGKKAAQLLNPGVFDAVVKPRLDQCFQGKVVNYELRYGYPQMGERDLAITYLPVDGPHGIDRVACVLRDITERKQAEERLREFERILENVDEMIVVVDRQYERVMSNRSALNWRRITNEQVLRSSASDVVTPCLFDEIKEKIDECFLGKVVTHEMRQQYADGIRHVSITYSPIEGTTGIDRVACVARDITQQRLAEEALRESESRERARAKELETVLDAVPVPVYIARDRACRRVTGNRAAYEQLRTSKAYNFSKSVPSKEQPKFRLMQNGTEIPAHSLPMQQAASLGTPIYGSAWTIAFEDGTQRHELVNAVPLLNEDGTIRGAVAAAIDVTELKRAEEALRQSEERFRVALKNSPISVFNQDRDLRYTWMYNPTVSEASGYLGKTPHELFGREEAERMAVVRRKVLETGVGTRHDVEITDSGKKHFFDTTIEPLLNSAGEVVGITAASMDVTELREATEALREAKRKLTEEKLYLEQEIDTELGFGEIIGQSKPLQEVMKQVGKVASSNATVLLLGETGTGKELVARAIHRLSQRHSNNFIKMNCAAIPSGLLESELFGNERGAFTGAVSKKIGRLELADNGTLFLDEIGEIAPALQPKLLRVLQDQEFERLGGNHTIKVNFRLIAATNADLADRVRENEFRSDLYYRLNVFPIRVPPLRERREDIRLLVEHFVQKCAQRMNKSITSIPKKTMDALMAWDWPGNVRELENFVERSVILTQGSVLVAPLNVLDPSEVDTDNSDQTLQSAERDYILRALRESHGKIGGPRGAAMRLGLKRTTLQSKMKHLGISSHSSPPTN